MNNYYDPPYREIDVAGFGRLIKDKREEIGLTQTDLAKALGISVSLISQWENNERSVTFAKLITVMNVLNINIGQIITPVNKPYEDLVLQEEADPYDTPVAVMQLHAPPASQTKINYKNAALHRLNLLNEAEAKYIMQVIDSLIELRTASHTNTN